MKVKAAGVCHSDWHIMNGDWQVPLPMVLGHEAAGVVEDVGAGVASVKPGDHVIFSFRPHCGRCLYCSIGRSILCDGHSVTALAACWTARTACSTCGQGDRPDGAHRHLLGVGRLPGRDAGADPQGHAVAAGRARRLLRAHGLGRREPVRERRGGGERGRDRLRRRRPERRAGRPAGRRGRRSSRPTCWRTSSSSPAASAPPTPSTRRRRTSSRKCAGSPAAAAPTMRSTPSAARPRRSRSSRRSVRGGTAVIVGMAPDERAAADQPLRHGAPGKDDQGHALRLGAAELDFPILVDLYLSGRLQVDPLVEPDLFLDRSTTASPPCAGARWRAAWWCSDSTGTPRASAREAAGPQ